MLDDILNKIKKYIPKRLFNMLAPTYHYGLALLGAIIYGFPSRKIKVVGITGTKGKTSTTELVNAILEKAGYKTSVSSTLRFKIGEKSKRNLYKMTLPGRFFLQKFLRDSVKNKCDYAVVELTSEAAKQFRHKFVSLDALIFTNLKPEHIESHGSFEKYAKAKLSLADNLKNKKGGIMISNTDDDYGKKFLDLNIEKAIPYSIQDASEYKLQERGLEFYYNKSKIISHLSGKFNIYNILAAIKFAESQNIDMGTVRTALEEFSGISGRVEYIELDDKDSLTEKHDFSVVVDYAHTTDSLEKLYEAFENSNKICVLGSTGGSRDKWKRPEMGRVASKYCEQIILTNEDPYDEDPSAIIKEIEQGIDTKTADIMMDRRSAIRKALSIAKTGDVVLITGKGTDPYIMGPNGTKTKWSDADVTREELKKVLEKK